MKFTCAASWSLNVLTGHRSVPHWSPVAGAADGVSVGAEGEVVGVETGEAVGVLDSEPSPQAATISSAASQATRIRTARFYHRVDELPIGLRSVSPACSRRFRV